MFGQTPAEALVRPHLDEARRHHRHLQHIAEMRKHPRSDRPRRRSRIGEHAANRGDRCPVIGLWCRSIISRNQFQHRRCQRPARLEHPLPGILNSCGGEGLWRFTLPHSSSENSIPIMIRALRGQLSHRRAQAQFQRILREPDPLLRAALPAVAMPAVNHDRVPARTKPTPASNTPTMFGNLNTTRATTGRQPLASILATTAAILTTQPPAPRPARPVPWLPEITTRRWPPNTTSWNSIPRVRISRRTAPGRSTRRSSARARPTHHPSGRSGHGQVPTVNTIAEPHRIRT